MDLNGFTTVLGHPRVLDPGVLSAARRVLAYDGDEVVGVAAFEPLFARQGEAAIAVAAGSSGALVSFLLDGITELADSSGLRTLRFALAMPDQRRRAADLTAGRATSLLRSDRLEVRTCHSTGPFEQGDVIAL